MYRHVRSSGVIACGCIETTMFSRSSTSLPSPTRGYSIIVIPIEWPVTCPSLKPRSVKPFETALCTSWAEAPAFSVARAASTYSWYASHPGERLACGLPAQIGRENSTQWPPGPAISSP